MRRFKLLTTVTIYMAMVLCISCKKDDVEPSDSGSTNTVATVTTNEVTELTATTAICGGEVKSENGWAVTERGVCWSTNQNPTLSDSRTVDGKGLGNFTSEITGLEPDTKYYVRAYAKNAAGTGFGSEKSFTTQSGGGGTVHTVPTVTTNEVTEITETSAVCGGFVVSDCGSAVTARGVCWSTSPNPTISCQHTTDGNGTGSFTSNITGLTANTTYYVKAYATNGAGTGYGEQKSFTTQSGGTVQTVPTVTTNEVTGLTETSAVCGGFVVSDCGSAVTARGVCWSTSPNPTISCQHTTDGNGTGSFTSNITGLTANTTYYVKAYATNGAGTGYGEQKSFTTQSGGTVQTVPTVTTNEVTGLTETSAVCGGFVVSDCGSAVTARGVCWSTSPNPTISCQHTTDGNGTGSFTSNITGLTANTTYYVKAYATNGAGTGYGEQKSFTTQSGGGSGGGVIAGHEYVDLGLPSGLLWATCNVGADSPEDYGNYYAWGETETKSYYDWSTYKWCNGSYNTLTKYCTDSYYGTVDNKTVLDPEDDAAHVNWGGDWRMPTREEMKELEENCTWTSTTQSGVRGKKVTGPNGSSIFLPKAGFYSDGSLNQAGSYGYYWASSLNTDNSIRASKLSIGSGMGSAKRYLGHSIRPVYSSQN